MYPLHGRRLRWAVILAVLSFLTTGDAVIAPRFVLPAQAQAVNPELSLGAVLQPEGFVSPGNGTITFTLTNPHSYPLRNVLLIAPDGSMESPQSVVDPGATAIFTHTHAVTQAELDAGHIDYMVVLETDEGSFRYPVEIAVQLHSAYPDVELLRRLSGAQAEKGQPFTVLYQVRNTGNIPMNHLVLQDSLGDYTGELDTLAVGASHNFINTVTIDEASESLPSLQYTPENQPDEVLTVQLEPTTVSVGSGLLSVDFSAEKTAFSQESVNATLTLRNEGDVDYPNLTVFDDAYGGIIADSISLPAGSDPLVIQHTYPLRGDAAYRWRIVGSSATGVSVDTLTDTVSVPDDSSSNSALLTLDAATDMPEIKRGGQVRFHLRLTNLDKGLASNIQLQEQTQGQVGALTVVPPGDPTELTVLLPVHEDGEFRFTATYEDPTGYLRTAIAEPVRVTVGAGGVDPVPEAHEDSLFSGKSLTMGTSSLFLVLMVSATLILIFLSFLMLLTSQRARKSRRERDVAHKLRLREALGKTNPFSPIKRKK